MTELGIIDVSWEDVLFTRLLPFLSLKDCFNLRCVSSDYKNLVDSYFSQLKTVTCLPGLPQFKVVVANAEHVRELSLTDSSWLDSASFQTFCKQNQNLNKVCLINCNGLNSAALHPLIMNSANLVELRLRPCPWIDGGCLETLSLHAVNLEVLELNSCFELTDTSLIFALKRFPKLRILEVINNRNISDITLFTLAVSCKEIEYLNFTGCIRLSPAGEKFLQHCPKLKSTVGICEERIICALRFRARTTHKTKPIDGF